MSFLRYNHFKEKKCDMENNSRKYETLKIEKDYLLNTTLVLNTIPVE